MGLLPDIEIMPENNDGEYVKHVYAICILWTLFVVLAAIGFGIISIMSV